MKTNLYIWDGYEWEKVSIIKLGSVKKPNPEIQGIKIDVWDDKPKSLFG